MRKLYLCVCLCISACLLSARPAAAQAERVDKPDPVRAAGRTEHQNEGGFQPLPVREAVLPSEEQLNPTRARRFNANIAVPEAAGEKGASQRWRRLHGLVLQRLGAHARLLPGISENQRLYRENDR
jgi:hypothetical protein